MKTLRTQLSLLAATVAVLALPQVAGAEYYVPPSNSAATQYTESFPTAGGDRNAENGGATRHHSPAKVLGTRNAQRLESQGPEGHAVAEIAAETAPTDEGIVVTQSETSAKTEAAPGHTKSKPHPEYSIAPARPVSEPQSPQSTGPSGSSGLGEVIGEATGSSSSGGLGIMLPLLLLGTVAWALVYVSSSKRKKPAA